NLPTSTTANTWILVATSGFGSLPGGVTPDYIIPSNFFPTGGGTLNYASGVQSCSYGVVPTDGYHSLLRNVSTAVHSPHNFAREHATRRHPRERERAHAHHHPRLPALA